MENCKFKYIRGVMYKRSILNIRNLDYIPRSFSLENQADLEKCKIHGVR